MDNEFERFVLTLGDSIAAAMLSGYVPKLPMRFEPTPEMSPALVSKIERLIKEGYLP